EAGGDGVREAGDEDLGGAPGEGRAHGPRREEEREGRLFREACGPAAGVRAGLVAAPAHRQGRVYIAELTRVARRLDSGRVARHSTPAHYQGSTFRETRRRGLGGVRYDSFRMAPPRRGRCTTRGGTVSSKAGTLS